MTKIAVIGTGYVGLVSGLGFASIGHDVICVDNNCQKIEQLNKGKIPIFEPRLEQLLQTAVAQNKISFSGDLKSAVQACQAVFIAVGTPQNEKTGSADLSFVFSVAAEIAANINSHKVIITKSTVPVGTNLQIKALIQASKPAASFSIVSNPEFLREGFAVADFLEPERIVIGVEDQAGQAIMAEIYQSFQVKTPIVFTDITTAEMIKYAANAFLAAKICFINEMADLCEKVGANVQKLALAIGMDSRIGAKFLNPGPGFGGSCFPKDILALENIAKENNINLSLVTSTINSNQFRKEAMVQRIINAAGDVKGKIITVLGLAFKGNTDDIRYSPALTIIEGLIKAGAKIHTYDPQAMKNCQQYWGNNSSILYFDNQYLAVENADLTVIASEWDEFRELDLLKIRQLQKTNLLIDLRNILDGKKAREAGFNYFGIGGV